MIRDGLTHNTNGVFSIFGAIKWVIIGAIIVGVVVLAYLIYSNITEWVDDTCDAGQSITTCIVDEGSGAVGNVLWDAVVGTGVALVNLPKNIANRTQKYNIFNNGLKIWKHYFK